LAQLRDAENAWLREAKRTLVIFETGLDGKRGASI
jgi:hypothetical protein